jgi:myo-inositol-1(or 4)-monophosphatase
MGRVESIVELVEPVREAGRVALVAQRAAGSLARTYKRDGSVLTELDQQVEERLVDAISSSFPRANLIAEESEHPLDRANGDSFAIDPIDGTDVFSQGMPFWCVSVGLLDPQWQPVAGIIYAPALDLLLFADVDRKATRDGCPLEAARGPRGLSARSNLMVSSRLHHRLDLARYPGKLRGIGSAALHLCFPLLYPDVVGAVQQEGACIWDLAGAHAILLSHGLGVEYLSGKRLDYSRLAGGEPAGDIVISGSRQVRDELRTMVSRR